MEELKIREFQLKDYDTVIEFWTKVKLSFRPLGRDRKKKIEIELKRGNAIFLVAELEGKIIGTIFGTHDGRRGWINRLAVDPELRKMGIARLLVAELEQRISKLGIDIIASLVEDWNTESMVVFEKLGYVRHNDVTYFSKRKNKDV